VRRRAGSEQPSAVVEGDEQAPPALRVRGPQLDDGARAPVDDVDVEDRMRGHAAVITRGGAFEHERRHGAPDQRRERRAA